MPEYSISPTGERLALPSREDYAGEYKRLQELAAAARSDGKEVVVVMGLGFVGAVMAGIIADTLDRKDGHSSKFVIGCQRPSSRSYWKTPLLNRGQSPVKSEDPEVDPTIARCVLEEKDADRYVQLRLSGFGYPHASFPLKKRLRLLFGQSTAACRPRRPAQ